MIYPQTVTYALGALCHLARQKTGSYVKVREISAELEIPPHFLGKVLSQLVRRQLLISSKGPTGGVALAKNPDRISVADVITALDADTLHDEHCILGFGGCSNQNACPFQRDWDEYKIKLSSVTQGTTVSTLAGACA